MRPDAPKWIITADDFGIGVATSRGILDLATAGRITSTVLLTNSPYAQECVELWRSAGRPVPLGWHPALTLDAPLCPPDQVPSLVQADGRFPPLGVFLRRLFLNQLKQSELHAELAAQLQRFMELVGEAPAAVNGHHHCHIWPPVRRVLLELLKPLEPRPFLRRVVESPKALVTVPGVRLKRLLLHRVGRKSAHFQQQSGFPGADQLLGLCDTGLQPAPDFFTRWIHAAHPKSKTLELMCHPGYFDDSLIGRDGTAESGHLARRVMEYELLRGCTTCFAIRRQVDGGFGGRFGVWRGG
ncbi:MAG: carbohydrate deacetylase [Gemmataceae bacterium]